MIPGLVNPPLRNQAALQIAFGGCGMPMQEALRRGGIQPSNTAAVLDLLGELLMVAGKGCLPGPTRDPRFNTTEEVKRWSKLSADEQLSNLKKLMGMLTTPPEWRGTSRQPSARKPMLPTQIGSWDGRRDMPSCYGMALIMASHGYLTRGPMLVASVQRTAAERAVLGMRVLCESARSFIADTLPLAILADRLYSWLEQAADSIEQSIIDSAAREFHGAVVIFLRDGRAVSLDPYMENMAILEHSVPHSIASPTGSSFYQGPDTWDKLAELKAELEAVCTGIQQILADTDSAAQSLFELALQVTELINQFDVPMSWSSDNVLSLAVASDEDPEPDMQLVHQQVAAAETTPDRGVLQQRIILGALRAWANKMWSSAQYTRHNEPHQSMLLLPPKRTMAVWALNNLRHRNPKGPRGIDLLPYSGSDVTFFNAWQDMRRGLSKPGELPLLDVRRRTFEAVPEQWRHPLINKALNPS
jgi:hypothetical protein